MWTCMEPASLMALKCRLALRSSGMMWICGLSAASADYIRRLLLNVKMHTHLVLSSIITFYPVPFWEYPRVLRLLYSELSLMMQHAMIISMFVQSSYSYFIHFHTMFFKFLKEKIVRTSLPFQRSSSLDQLPYRQTNCWSGYTGIIAGGRFDTIESKDV